MIVILYDENCKAIAQAAETDFMAAFQGHVQTVLVSAVTATAWPGDVEWDDILVVLYDSPAFPDAGNKFIQDYIQKRPDTSLLLPVAANIAFRKPPEAAAAIKALPYDVDAPGADGKLVHRVGAMLGLRLQGRDSKIFISYRATDGTYIANQLDAYLTARGYRPWLDEAKDVDGDTAILPGTPVQKEIDVNLRNASLVLLIDTPSAPDSEWIQHEVDTADSMLIPILPVCFRRAAETKKGSRFRSLVELQRDIRLPFVEPPVKDPLSDGELNEIAIQIEIYLCEIFRRKCRVPFLVKNEFETNGFKWNVLDQELMMFSSARQGERRITTTVLSHCSIFDQIYTPALKRFINFLNVTGRKNYSLFIYDGELLSARQLDEFYDADMIVLHHQELSTLISSGFTTVGIT
ncbi:toll/interleukin-1 receptor domain-containing protein [Herbaspirillum lusitanum]|uniref:toll/interleukin-1 receptor domain-containing protein n=1 Tax=Herbaspirillum lusitanum TaxID=213312 RepID=UPI0022373BCB|nr:toll/interleukin-1 receptor domain-containing protein [Herbaspirillum lusitanum]MCW5300352.1 toll/interleukin-1 receptor domain-containing protein [Herbaspirillum lusitanum]